MRSLAVKINGALLFDGKATALPVEGGQALKIAVNQGVQVQLIAGPKDFDSLAGLGLKPRLLTNDKADAPVDKNAPAIVTDNATHPAAAATTLGPQTIGLGIDVSLDLLSKTTAGHADNALQGAMALIKQAYGKLNTPASANSLSATGASGPAYLQAQLAGYQTALTWLNLMNAPTTSSTF